MLFRNVVNQLFDKYSLTYTCTTKQTNFTSLQVRLQKVNYLNTCKQDFLSRSQVLEFRRFAMDGEASGFVQSLHSVDGFANHVHYSAFDLGSYRHCDRLSGRYDLHSTL